MAVDVELEGVKFRCYPFHNTHDKWFYEGSIFANEKDQLDFIAKHVSNAGVFVDIGANTGAICITVALRHKTIRRLLAIEPDPMNFDRLVYNSNVNNISTISFIQCAVGETEA